MGRKKSSFAIKEVLLFIEQFQKQLNNTEQIYFLQEKDVTLFNKDTQNRMFFVLFLDDKKVYFQSFPEKHEYTFK